MSIKKHLTVVTPSSDPSWPIPKLSHQHLWVLETNLNSLDIQDEEDLRYAGFIAYLCELGRAYVIENIPTLEGSVVVQPDLTTDTLRHLWIMFSQYYGKDGFPGFERGGKDDYNVSLAKLLDARAKAIYSPDPVYYWDGAQMSLIQDESEYDQAMRQTGMENVFTDFQTWHQTEDWSAGPDHELQNIGTPRQLIPLEFISRVEPRGEITEPSFTPVEQAEAVMSRLSSL